MIILLQKIILVVTILLFGATSFAHELKCEGKNILGTNTKVELIEQNLSLQSKLDTGANMSSLCAENINIINKNNHRIVKFYICGTDHKQLIEKPLYKFVKIRGRNEENMNFMQRPVVLLKIKIGEDIQWIPINLTNRTHFQFPMLLGKDALVKFKIIVDPSLH